MKQRTIIFLSHVDMNLYLFRLPIMKALIDKGWSVYALVPEGEYCKHISSVGVKVINYFIDRKSLNPLKEIRTILDIKRKINKVKPDVLHTFTAKPNIYGAIVGRMSGVPVIIGTVTGLGSFFVERSIKAKIVSKLILGLYKLSCKLSTFTVFQNYDDYKEFIDMGIVIPEKSKVIKGSGIDTDIWKPIKKTKNEVVRVITVGRLIKHKGIYEFLNVARILKEKYSSRIEFIVVGDVDKGNPYSIDTQIMNKFVKKGVIKWIKWMEHEELKKIMANTDIFVLLSSYREGLPRTGIEALALGLPIVISNVTGCREIVDDGINGFLVNPHNTKGIANKIENLIIDAHLRNRMGKASREKAIREFDVRKIVNEYVSLYEELLRYNQPNG